MSTARSRVFPIVAAIFATFQVTTARAQHASDNPVNSADDAYGLTVGLESVGLYNPGSVRGFSPISAGNVRIDGMFFDLQGAPSNRVVEGSTVHVGVSEIGYPFPAPTGIADYNLRNVGGDNPTATIIANVGPFDAWGVSIDGSIPLIGKELVLPIGVSTQISTQSSEDGGFYPGLTSRVLERGRNAPVDAEFARDGARTDRLAGDQRRENTSRIFHGRRFPPSLNRERLRGAELGYGPRRDDEFGGARHRTTGR